MRRNWLVAAIVVALAAIVVAALVVRLTDDSDDVEAWAGSVCASVSDWRASILALGDIEAGDLNAETLGEKIEDAEAATEDLVSELRDLDPPELDAATELDATLDAGADRLRASYDALRAEAEGALDADSPSEFLQELAALAPRFQSLLTEAARLVESLAAAPSLAASERAELQQAFQDADACEELRASA